MKRSSITGRPSLTFKRPPCNNENGAALVIALMFMAILGVLGTTAYVMTSTDMQIGANYKTSAQAFNATQAGIEEARARLRGNAANPIADNDPTSPNWETYIGAEPLAFELPDYANGDTIATSIHTFTDMDYAVQIMHAIDPATGQVLYWGDSDGDGISERNTTTGGNIYLITAYGTAGGSNETVTGEITQMPPVNPSAALYVEDDADVNSSDAEVHGNDQCGGSDLAGIATTESKISETEPVEDHHGSVEGNPNVKYQTASLPIQEIIDTYKLMADFTITPGNYQWQNWGTPTGTPATPDCAVSNIVYASGTVTLGKSTGCGILLVDGDLTVLAGFQWYGMVFISGCLKYTGNATSDGIYGAVMSKGTGCENKVIGNVKLHYCSTAVNNATANLPFTALSWKESN